MCQMLVTDPPAKRILSAEDEIIAAMDLATWVGDAATGAVGPAVNLKEAQSCCDQSDFRAAILDIRLAKATVWPVAAKPAEPAWVRCFTLATPILKYLQAGLCQRHQAAPAETAH